MTLVNGYVGPDDLRNSLGDDSQKLIAARLEDAINAASRAIDRYCRRKFWLDTAVTTKVFRVGCSDVAWVSDIGSTSGLVIKTDPGLDGSFNTTWTASDYQLAPLNSDIVDGSDTITPWAFWEIDAVGSYSFPVDEVRATLQVTARFGWSSIPDDVEQACLIKAAALYKRKDAPFGVANFGDFGPVRIGRQDPEVMELLAPYRRPLA